MHISFWCAEAYSDEWMYNELYTSARVGYYITIQTLSPVALEGSAIFFLIRL